MQNIKQDFPIFQTHPELVYLDSTATSQKPSIVIDGVAEYLRSSYANIHRGAYNLSEASETLYEDSKKIVAKHIGAKNWREIIYTSNSTYALNLLAQSIWRTGILKQWDTVLVSIVEHHANIVPWLILQEDYGINVEFVNITKDYDIDFDDLRDKLTDRVKVVSLTHVSNTTGQIFDLENVSSLLTMKYGADTPLFIVDGSQSVPHFGVDVANIGCDAMFFTGHKIFADSGIGVLWAKESLLSNLQPIFSGGGAIACVEKWSFTPSKTLPERFEPGTPNLSWAVSLLKAFEYIENIGGYKTLETIEHELVVYALEKFEKLPDVTLIWSHNAEKRVWVFSFVVTGIHSHDIAEYLAEHNIAIRAGQHCAEPFMQYVGEKHSCRMSLHIYNTRQDIDRFFEVLSRAINELK